jgi:hypothetical protein
VPDQTKYQPAYDACIANTNSSSWVCQVAGNQAVKDDARTRFIAAFVAMAQLIGPAGPAIFGQFQLLYQQQQ